MKLKKILLMASFLAMGTAGMAQSPQPGIDGNKYVPYENRVGNESVVYFTRDLSAEGLIKAYEQVNALIDPGSEWLDFLPRGHHGRGRHLDASREGRQVV